MRDGTDFLETVKRIAIGAVRSTKPVEVTIGKVKAVKPLAVSVEGALTLQEEFLIKTEKACNPCKGCEGCEGCDGCKGYSGLAKGDSVVLLRAQGGQKYVVLDKVVK